MTISVLLKDYIERLHDLSLLDHMAFFSFIKATTIYIIQSVVLSFWYVVSFQWFWDFLDIPAVAKDTYLAVSHPTFGYFPKSRGFWGMLTGLFTKRQWVPHEPIITSLKYSFLDTAPLNTKSIFSGFLNSFFLCLPLSIPHLLTVRALLVKGIPAGIASALGTILGQTLFFGCILLGFEVILQPFLQFEPLVILLGCCFVLEVLSGLGDGDFTMVHAKQTKVLFKFFRINFALAWLEQACIGSSFGNLTFTNTSSILDTTDGDHFLLVTLTYILGLFIGSCIWSILFSLVLFQVRALLDSIFIWISAMQITQKIHYSLSFLCVLLAMSSFPYYGIDYLVANGFGYVAEDSATEFMQTRYREVNEEREFEQTEEEPDGEGIILLNSKPFGDRGDRPDPNFESYGLLAEKEWRNRDSLRNRLEDKVGPPIPDLDLFAMKKAQMDMELGPFREKDYTTPTLVIDDIYYEPSSEDLRILDVVTDLTFRFDVYTGDRDRESLSYTDDTKVLRQFRKKYYNNVVYKQLLKMDTNVFLFGQPKTSRLFPNDEFALFKRRVILQNYLDTLGRYRMILEKRFVDFPHKVYNQQFKGSLNYIRRFNAVSINEYGVTEGLSNKEQGNPNLLRKTAATKKVLKYDQPLFKKKKLESRALLHEELKFKRKKFKNPRRYMKLSHSRPLYIGWDESLHKFMIRSSAVAPSLTNNNEFSLTIDPDSKPASVLKNPPKSLPEYYQFQAWSPGVEDAKPGTRFKLPSLLVTPEDKAQIQYAFGLVEESLGEEEDIERMVASKTRLADILNKLTLKNVFERLPLYDWYWALMTVEDIDTLPSVRLGDAAPPGLEGIGWPGRNDRPVHIKPELLEEEN